ncbi:hypothetical protein EXIGLDRAFT_716499 [Exidia glandulosa HHB12029]|uniref:F-box domain-containing protein n=1 Tax=Exidia glandulosa HHB12029 TaxID=1314781 RepID=A0A165P9Q9_EXIGL|nr:hypothetical protein EXIGLDRAFT_716499 [Exidia glandulosa HHB12029]
MDYTTRLPPELLAAVLDELKQPDVLRTAALSSRWRASAKDHPQFYAYLALKTSARSPYDRSSQGSGGTPRQDGPPKLLDQIDAFARRVREAFLRDMRLRLKVQLEERQLTAEQTPAEVGNSISGTLMNVISRVIQLDISIPRTVWQAMLTVLGQTAPLLRTLKINLGPMLAANMTEELVAGSAQNVNRLALVGFGMPPRTSLSSSNAVHVRLGHFPVTAFASICHVFPRVASLVVDQIIVDPAGPNDDIPRPVLGPAMRSLTLGVHSRSVWPTVFLDAFRRHGSRLDCADISFSSSSTVIDATPFTHIAPGALHVSVSATQYRTEVTFTHDEHSSIRRKFCVLESVERMAANALSQTSRLLESLSTLWASVTHFDMEWGSIERLLPILRSLPTLEVVQVDMRGFELIYDKFAPNSATNSVHPTRSLRQLTLYDRSSQARLYSNHVFDLSKILGVERWDNLRLQGARLNSPNGWKHLTAPGLFKAIEEA